MIKKIKDIFIIIMWILLCIVIILAVIFLAYISWGYDLYTHDKIDKIFWWSFKSWK